MTMALGKLSHKVLILVEQRGEVAQQVVVATLSPTYSEQQVIDVIDAMVRAAIIERYGETLSASLRDNK
jgi:hypothetical protein